MTDPLLPTPRDLLGLAPQFKGRNDNGFEPANGGEEAAYVSGWADAIVKERAHMARALAQHREKDGRYTPPLIDEGDGRYRYATAEEFAAALLDGATSFGG